MMLGSGQMIPHFINKIHQIYDFYFYVDRSDGLLR